MKIILFILMSAVSISAGAVPAEGHKIMISGPSPAAVETGRRIASQGGNVVDVSVAVALSLSVTSPYFASLGGGGFAMVKMGDQEVQALDFRESAPGATHKDYYKDLPEDSSINGGHAVGVPGVPAGLWALHQKYGKLPWHQLFPPALELANRGFPVSGEWVKRTTEEKSRFNPSGIAAFFKKDKQAYKPGQILKQPQLGKALAALRDRNLKGFYEGPVAADLVKAVRATRGKLSLDDLKNYKVRWLKPLTTEFEGTKIYLMPPPSSGGIVIFQALRMMEKLKLKNYAPLSVDELHLLAEIESRAFRGRSLLGDPDFHKNPISFLTSPAQIKFLTDSIQLKKATTLKPLSENDLLQNETTETTHFNVMDSEGHAVALTVTLNGTYGSGVVSDTFHIALNNEMDDFTTRPGEANMYGLVQGSGNDVEPGKRPLSSMSPTLVEKDGKIILAAGAPGGPRIVTAVLQGLYRALSQNLNVDMIAQMARVHHQFQPNVLYVDKNRLSPDVLQLLRDRGHKIEEAQGMGKLYLIHRRSDGILEGAFDNRGEGASGGI